MSEIEKYYNGEIHVDFEEDDLIGEIIEQHNEIERLKSIIKEVREYIEEIEKVDNYIFKMGFNDILEILDKGDNNGERQCNN